MGLAVRLLLLFTGYKVGGWDGSIRRRDQYFSCLLSYVDTDFLLLLSSGYRVRV